MSDEPSVTPRTPTPAAVVHGLWRDWRVLRSPLWLVVIACVLNETMYVLMGVESPFHGPTIHWAVSRLPCAAAMGCMAWGAHRTVNWGLGRDWLLTTAAPRNLERGIFTTPWIPYWVLLTLIGYQGLWTLMIVRNPLDMNYIATPWIRIGPLWMGRPGDMVWSHLSLALTIALIPVMIAMWAWFYRWLAQALIMRLSSPAVAWLAAVVAAVALSYANRNATDLFTHSISVRMQDNWPMTWSLGARIFCGAYLAWLIEPALLLILGFTARHFARRWRARWWERMT